MKEREESGCGDLEMELQVVLSWPVKMLLTKLGLSKDRKEFMSPATSGVFITILLWTSVHPIGQKTPSLNCRNRDGVQIQRRYHDLKG